MRRISGAFCLLVYNPAVLQIVNRIWPPLPQTTPKPWHLFLLTLTGGLCIGLLIQDAPFLGYDWVTMFHRNIATDTYYPPWTSWVLYPLAELPPRLGLGLINGITIATVAGFTYHNGRQNTRGWRMVAVLLALLSFQTAVVLWTGHIDGLALLAIWALPLAVPVLLMKATFIGFAVFARWQWLLAALVFAALSLLIWPGWPNHILVTLDFRNTHPASAGWHRTGWLPIVVGATLFLFSKRTDPFQLMAAGSLVYPFMLPYHYLVLLPVMGEMKSVRLVLAWALTWLMIFPAAFEGHFFVYFLFPLLIWWTRCEANGIAQTWWRVFAEFREPV
jgi:hypothetical protein